MAQVKDGKIKGAGCALVVIVGVVCVLEFLSGQSGIMTSPNQTVKAFFGSCRSDGMRDAKHYVTSNIEVMDGAGGTTGNADGTGPLIEGREYYSAVPAYKAYRNHYDYGSVKIAVIFEDPDKAPYEFSLTREWFFSWRVDRIDFVYE